jgi:hypothetical protein
MADTAGGVETVAALVPEKTAGSWGMVWSPGRCTAAGSPRTVVVAASRAESERWAPPSNTSNSRRYNNQIMQGIKRRGRRRKTDRELKRQIREMRCCREIR